jgi:hypothetical protein
LNNFPVSETPIKNQAPKFLFNCLRSSKFLPNSQVSQKRKKDEEIKKEKFFANTSNAELKSENKIIMKES